MARATWEQRRKSWFSLTNERADEVQVMDLGDPQAPQDRLLVIRFSPTLDLHRRVLTALSTEGDAAMGRIRVLSVGLDHIVPHRGEVWAAVNVRFVWSQRPEADLEDGHLSLALEASDHPEYLLLLGRDARWLMLHHSGSPRIDGEESLETGWVFDLTREDVVSPPERERLLKATRPKSHLPWKR